MIQKLFIPELLVISIGFLFVYLFHMHFKELYINYGQISNKCCIFRYGIYQKEVLILIWFWEGLALIRGRYLSETRCLLEEIRYAIIAKCFLISLKFSNCNCDVHCCLFALDDIILVLLYLTTRYLSDTSINTKRSTRT